VPQLLRAIGFVAPDLVLTGFRRAENHTLNLIIPQYLGPLGGVHLHENRKTLPGKLAAGLHSRAATADQFQIRLREHPAAVTGIEHNACSKWPNPE
jgi:hypothetical protein